MRAFSAYEWMIAWRYLRAKRREGGVSVMTWISLVGITLAVFALIATLAVRSGFRTEFTNTILGANAHVTLYSFNHADEFGRISRLIETHDELAARVKEVPGITRAAPTVRAQVMASFQGRNAGIEVYGQTLSDVSGMPLLAAPQSQLGSLGDLGNGIAIGSGVARELNISVGDKLTLISPNGVQTPFGTTPKVQHFEVVYIFQVGRYDIDKVRAYLPLEAAQKFFNRGNAVDEIEILVTDPEEIDAVLPAIERAAGDQFFSWTWRQSSGAFLNALRMEDNIMFVILSILVMIATLNITSGLVMLVKNKGRDIGILRTIGLSQGAIMRVFFICGSLTGVIGTICGVILGSVFAIYIDPIFTLVNGIAGGGVWDPSVRMISELPAELRLEDVLKSAGLALVLSCVVTILPARHAARLNPVEALRNE